MAVLIDPVGDPARSDDTAPAAQRGHPYGTLLPSDDRLRRYIVHDAGEFYTAISDGRIAIGLSTSGRDPETGTDVYPTLFPRDSFNAYIYGGALWVGGVVGGDTLVSVGFEEWLYDYELFPEEVDSGGARRTGNYADDEFSTVLVDTINIPGTVHSFHPLGLQIVQTSYSWADTAYDDFVILDYCISNIGERVITGGRVGLYIILAIYSFSPSRPGPAWEDYEDDCVGVLDTFLSEDNPVDRRIIPYAFEHDGNPSVYGGWDSLSTRGVIAATVLGSSFPVSRPSFNWWSLQYNWYDFGPRRRGTSDDPFRPFTGGGIGIPTTDLDRYYVLAHPEIDYNQIETGMHDYEDGWLYVKPDEMAMDIADGYAISFLLSVGSFSLAPGDTERVTFALVGGKNLHVSPFDFANYYQWKAPQAFFRRLDFSSLMTNLRRADSVYQSGYLLPLPGPPAGLRVIDFDEGFVTMAWHPSHRPDLAGYLVYVRDTLVDDHWFRALPTMVTDTMATVRIQNPTHHIQLAVSLVDNRGRESGLSRHLSILTAIPHPPTDLIATLAGYIPELTWKPYASTMLQAFMVYRQSWDGPLVLHDSTAGPRYRDAGAESGVQYTYRVSAKSVYEQESGLSEPVTVLTMARDQGVLYYNMNRYRSSPGPYPKAWLDAMYDSVAAMTPTARWDMDDGNCTFKRMSDYSLVIFDRSNLPRATAIPEDSLRYYLAGGGKAIIITGALGTFGTIPRIDRYGPGTFYHDFLKLDSAVTNPLVMIDNRFVGDLTECVPVGDDYPALAADTMKLNQAILPVTGYIPMTGYLFPTAEGEPIYRYVSSDPNAPDHGQINGIRYLSPTYGFVLLGFPLTPMEEPASFTAIRQALLDLGVDIGCGDIDGSERTDIGDIAFLIRYLYHAGPQPANINRADVNRDGVLDLADAVEMVNYIFRGGRLRCRF